MRAFLRSFNYFMPFSCRTGRDVPGTFLIQKNAQCLPHLHLLECELRLDVVQRADYPAAIKHPAGSLIDGRSRFCLRMLGKTK